jgi:hypothetical protein
MDKFKLNMAIIAALLAMAIPASAANDTVTVNGATYTNTGVQQGFPPPVTVYFPNGMFGPTNPVTVIPNNQPVGTANFTGPAPVTVTTSPTLLVAARTGAPGIGRVGVGVICAATVALGGSGVTFAGAPQLPVGNSITLYTTAAVYAIATGASTTCNAFETY